MILYILFILFLYIYDVQLTVIHKNSRIVNGKPALQNQFPWQTALVLCNPKGKGCGSCGGSLISRNFILTAAHCTDGKSLIDIGLGSIQRFQPLIKMKSKIKLEHPGFDRPAMMNDIALIKLPKLVTLSDSVTVIPLVTKHIGDLSGKNAIISGFGKEYPGDAGSSYLNFVELKVMKNDDCKKFYTKRLVDTKLCAIANYSTVCQGDSGGPLVMQNNESFVQIGVTSFTFRGCTPGKPSGYTRISEFIDWIYESMKLMSEHQQQ